MKKLGHLQNVSRGDYELFKKDLSAEVIPKAICDLLFEKYVATKKRSASDESAGDRKKRKVLDRNSKLREIQCFVGLHGTMEVGELFQFGENILGSETSTLWVRSCYPRLYDKLWSDAVLLDNHGNDVSRPLVVTGTSGIGKSFFGVYAAYRAVKEKGITIVYNFRNQYRVVIAPPRSDLESFRDDDPRKLLLQLVGKHNIQLDQTDDQEDDETREHRSMWWGRLRVDVNDTFYEELVAGESTWIFVDLHNESLDEPSRRVMAFVSNREERFRSFLKHNDGYDKYLSVWSKEEVMTFDSLASLQLGEQDIQKRFDVVGGVPRLLFSKNWRKTLVKVDEAIQKLNNANINVLLTRGSNPDVTSRLVHEYASEDFEKESQKFASLYVRLKVIQRFFSEKQFETKAWLDYTGGLIENSVRGPVFEWFAHVVVGKLAESIPVKLTSLFENGSQETQKKIMQPFANATRVFDDANSVNNVKIGEYMQPKNPNYPAIDSFIVCEGVPWEASVASNQDPTLIFFQMTVARKNHPTLGQPIKNIINALDSSDRVAFDSNKHDIYLVFIVESPLPKFESYLGTGKKAISSRQLGKLKKIKQFCLQLEGAMGKKINFETIQESSTP